VDEGFDVVDDFGEDGGFFFFFVEEAGFDSHDFYEVWIGEGGFAGVDVAVDDFWQLF